MTLRDYFAAASLQGHRASETDMSINKWGPKETAMRAYDDADAMLAERSHLFGDNQPLAAQADAARKEPPAKAHGCEVGE
jgi:hypothetical protein